MSSQQEDPFLFYSSERGESSNMSSYQEDQFLFIVQRGENLAICPAIKGISSFL
jgi:hypothetical protein